MIKIAAIGLLLMADIFLFPLNSAHAENRIALVIGNATYGPNITRLSNPALDANLVVKSLKALHYDVEVLIDANQITMKRAILRLGTRLKAAGKNSTGFFYYAGHGLEDQSRNYLIPVDAEINSPADLDLVAVDAASVMNQMQSSTSSANIIILDACRDTPFARDIGGHRGFAVQYAPAGTFIGYSTAPFQTATDGIPGQNSPFAAAFAKEVLREGTEINDTYIFVRKSVLAATNNRQVAWDASSLIAQYYFSPATKGGTAVVVAAAEPSYDRTSAGVVTRGIVDNSDEGKALNWLDGATKSNIVTVVANRTAFHRGSVVKYLVKSQVEGYIALFSVGPDKKVNVLHPGPFDRSASINAGESKYVPGTTEIIAPFGPESVFAIVTKRPLFNNGSTPLCGPGKVENICPGFYQHLLDLRKRWSLIDPQTGAGDWAFGAAHYVSEP